MRKASSIARAAVLLALVLLTACESEEPAERHPEVARAERLPADIAKRGPETDPHPPILHAAGFAPPEPLAGTVNTAGAEDSPFILPDGSTLYFFFTPDVRVPPEGQLFDDVSGVWVAERSGETWSEAERVWLQEPGRLALDGAVCVQDDELWFASAREGYEGVNMFTAEQGADGWGSWRYVGDRLMHEIGIGEVHLYGDTLYFHADRVGGLGSYDIWKTVRTGEDWSDPLPIEAVNSAALEGWPWVSNDGGELWFTRIHLGTPAIFRSLRANGVWQEPEMIVSQFAGEPTLDDAGNLYFVHHYYEDDVMIEADIYLARRMP